jgi:hypothetical protein
VVGDVVQEAVAQCGVGARLADVLADGIGLRHQRAAGGHVVQQGLQFYLCGSVKVHESHALARPMVHLDPEGKLMLELQAPYAALQPAPVKTTKKAAKR